jgi:phosphoribosylanthranilate isomerase
MVRTLPPFVTAVGVFVDQPVAYVQSVANLVRLGAVQLHGRESPSISAGLPYRVIKAMAVTDDFAPDALDEWPADVLPLLDAHDPVKRGGTGRTIDWSRAAAAARRRPVVLSGGLTARNVRDAVETVRPYAVDVSSGVEARPGVKDPARLREFFAALER